MSDLLDDPMFDGAVLPGNATALELAFDAAFAARASALPGGATIADVLRWDVCPPLLLPWLAWEWSVDQYDPAWSDAHRREAIRRSPADHAIKGSDRSILDAVALWGWSSRRTARLELWHDHARPAFTFRVIVDNGVDAFLSADAARLSRTVLLAKNVRSHLDRLTIRQRGAAAPIYVGARAVSRIRTRPLADAPVLHHLRGPIFVGARAHSHIRTRPS